jgi:hypothetical protein
MDLRMSEMKSGTQDSLTQGKRYRTPNIMASATFAPPFFFGAEKGLPLWGS